MSDPSVLIEAPFGDEEAITRAAFAAAHQRVMEWEPAPCPPPPWPSAPSAARIPHLDEIERPRGWSR